MYLTGPYPLRYGFIPPARARTHSAHTHPPPTAALLTESALATAFYICSNPSSPSLLPWCRTRLPRRHQATVRKRIGASAPGAVRHASIDSHPHHTRRHRKRTRIIRCASFTARTRIRRALATVFTARTRTCACAARGRAARRRAAAGSCPRGAASRWRGGRRSCG